MAQLPEGIARFFPLATESNIKSAADASADAVGTGLPKDILLPILESLREDIAEIRDVLSEVELRMVGGSLLVLYEADWECAREGVKLWLEDDPDAEEQDEDDEDDDEEDEENKKPSPPYTVKLIDFAHTRLAPGAGPDKGVLLGLDNILKLIDGRIKEVKASP